MESGGARPKPLVSGDADSATAAALFVENAGPDVVSLGTGAFGKVWLGRAKLDLPPLPTLTRSMASSSNDLLSRSLEGNNHSSFRNSLPGGRRSTAAAPLVLSPGEPVALKEISLAKTMDGVEGSAAARKEAKFLARCQVCVWFLETGTFSVPVRPCVTTIPF